MAFEIRGICISHTSVVFYTDPCNLKLHPQCLGLAETKFTVSLKK